MTHTLEHLNADTTPSEPIELQTREEILDGADELRQEMKVFIGRSATIDSIYNFTNLDPEDIVNE